MNIRSVARISVFMLFTSCFLVASPAYAQKLKIQKATPSWAEQGTGTEVDPLPVLIDGEGFDDVVQVRFLVSGTKVTGGIKVESYSIEGPNQITAKVTVEGDAVLDYFDIEMTTSRGRRARAIRCSGLWKKVAQITTAVNKSI